MFVQGFFSTIMQNEFEMSMMGIWISSLDSECFTLKKVRKLIQRYDCYKYFVMLLIFLMFWTKFPLMVFEWLMNVGWYECLSHWCSLIIFGVFWCYSSVIGWWWLPLLFFLWQLLSTFMMTKRGRNYKMDAGLGCYE